MGATSGFGFNATGEFIVTDENGSDFGKLTKDSQGNGVLMSKDKNGNYRRAFPGELSSAQFNSASQIHVTFSAVFPSVPRIFLQLDNGPAVLTVKPINVTTAGFDIKASASYTGPVGYFAAVV